jgi:hypothetical protein
VVTRRVWIWPVRRPSRTTQDAAPRRRVVGGDVLEPRPFAHPVAGRVADFGGELAVVDVDDQVPAPARVEAERDALVGGPDGALAEGVLEFVAVPPLFDGADDRLHLEVVEAADPPQRVLHLGLLLVQLALIGEALPGGAGARLAAVDATVREAVGAGAQQLDRPRLGEALLAFRHLGEDAIARQPARDEDDEAVRAGDPAAAEGQRVDLDLEPLAPARRPLGRLGVRPGLHLGEFPARLADEFLQLAQQRVGLFAAAFEQLADHLLRVAVGHPAAFDRVVDDLLDAVPAQRDAVLERVTKLGEALVDPDRFRFRRRGFFAGVFAGFRRRFFRRGFFGSGFFRFRRFFGAARFSPSLFFVRVRFRFGFFGFAGFFFVSHQSPLDVRCLYPRPEYLNSRARVGPVW